MITNLRFVLNSDFNSPVWISVHFPSAELTKCFGDVGGINLKVFFFCPRKYFCCCSIRNFGHPGFSKPQQRKPCFPQLESKVTGALSLCKHSQFTDGDLTKPELQLSRLYQGCCHPKTPIGQDICLPRVGS